MVVPQLDYLGICPCLTSAHAHPPAASNLAPKHPALAHSHKMKDALSGDQSDNALCRDDRVATPGRISDKRSCFKADIEQVADRGATPGRFSNCYSVWKQRTH